MATDDMFPTNITPEEEKAGFAVTQIPNPKKPLLLAASDHRRSHSSPSRWTHRREDGSTGWHLVRDLGCKVPQAGRDGRTVLRRVDDDVPASSSAAELTS
jgi:hypothetical protein